MVRIRLTLLTAAFLTALLLGVAPPASAQNTALQTTCGGVSGVNSCLTNGFLQDLTVNCGAGFPANQVATALAQITDRNGPNRITLSGSGCGGVGIVGFNRLTIVGDGSPVGGFWNIINSRNVVLKSMTFDFSVQAGNLNMQGAQVAFDGITVTNALGDVAVGLVGSTLGFTGSPSVITNNRCIGINVAVGSRLNLVNVTVSNNGLGQGCGSASSGIHVREGGSVILSNQINVNGTVVDAPVDVSGNGQEGGLDVEAGSVWSAAETGNAMIRIHDNMGPGLQLGAGSSADIEGHIQFDGNNPNGSDGFPPSQVVASANATLGIGQGVIVQGQGGSSLAAYNAFVLIGNGGPMTIGGGVALVQGSTGFLASGNTIDTLSCDGTSWMSNFDHSSTIGSNTCPESGPAGITGPAGPQGATGPQGPPGGVAGLERVTAQATFTLARNASRGLTATCPAGKVVIGGAAGAGDPTFAIIASGPGPDATTQWSANFWNTAIGTRTRTVTVTAICAIAQ